MRRFLLGVDSKLESPATFVKALAYLKQYDTRTGFSKASAYPNISLAALESRKLRQIPDLTAKWNLTEGEHRGMLNSLYTNRTFLSIAVFIFAGQAAYTIHQGRLISGSVLGAMALLALILILFVIYKHDGTIFNKTTLFIMIYTVLGTCIYLGILVLFANF